MATAAVVNKLINWQEPSVDDSEISVTITEQMKLKLLLGVKCG